jgi:hypothetical protein
MLIPKQTCRATSAEIVRRAYLQGALNRTCSVLRCLVQTITISRRATTLLKQRLMPKTCTAGDQGDDRAHDERGERVPRRACNAARGDVRCLPSILFSLWA